MKKILASLLFAGVLAACGDDNTNDTMIESPSETEAAPDSTMIQGDSAAGSDSLGVNLGADDNNTYRDNATPDTSRP
jgi:hypothetical protein